MCLEEVHINFNKIKYCCTKGKKSKKTKTKVASVLIIEAKLQEGIFCNIPSVVVKKQLYNNYRYYFL